MAGFERSPIRFFNLVNRGPYPEDMHRRWLVAGTPPFNEAMARARGVWMAPFADDDAMRPHHLSSLLGAARDGLNLPTASCRCIAMTSPKS